MDLETSGIWSLVSLQNLFPLISAAILSFVFVPLSRALPKDSPFRLAAATVGLVLFPIAVGGYFGLGTLVHVLRAFGETGMGGAGALAAGMLEALLPLLFGLAGATAIALFGFVLLVKVRGREKVVGDAPEGTAAARSGTTFAFLVVGSLLALLFAMTFVSRLLGAFSSLLAVAGGWAPAGSVEAVSSSLAIGVQIAYFLSALAALLGIVLAFGSFYLRPGALAGGSTQRVVALGLVLSVLGWAALSTVRVWEAVKYCHQTALAGKAEKRVF